MLMSMRHSVFGLSIAWRSDRWEPWAAFVVTAVAPRTQESDSTMRCSAAETGQRW